MPVYLGNKKCKIYIGNTKIQEVYLGTKKVYPCGNTVTYCVDTGVIYQEEIDEGKSCLSPSSFSPAKSGWTFVGWRQDTTASNEVINSLVMAESPITLYAVFQQTLTLSYDGNGSTGGSAALQTGPRYYNNGNVANPSFTLQSNGFSKSGYTFSKWAMGSTGGTQYSEGANITLSASTTMYAVWASAGNPFYVVKNNQFVADDIYWVHGFVSGTNIDHIGMPSWNQVWGYAEDETERSSFVAKSPFINTRYNSKLRITASCSSDWSDGYVKVNGQTLNCSGTKIFDISELSSVQIEVGASAWPFGHPVVAFNEVYFY